MKKNIYIISLNGIGNTGGVERVSNYLYNILSEKYNVNVIAKGKLSLGKIDNVFYPFFIALKLLFIPNKFVISNSWHSFFFPADVSIHHGTSAGVIKACGSSFGLKVNAFMEKVSAKCSKKVIAVSENCRDELINIYNIKSNKVITVDNFVDETIFFPKSEVKENKELTILFCGTLCDRKGLGKLKALSDYIEIYNQKEDISKKIKLIIATNNGNNSDLFKNNQNTEIKVGLTLNTMNDFYNEGDILFFPSLYEGFSMATLEALSAGIPVVGTKAAIPDELIGYDFCYRFTEDSEEQILKEIGKLYEKFAEKKQFIHDSISKDFGKEQYSKKILQLVD